MSALWFDWRLLAPGQEGAAEVIASHSVGVGGMLMDVTHVALTVIAGAIIAAVVVVLARSRLLSAKAALGDAAEKLRRREAELGALRAAKSESDRALAVAEEKASRIAGVEAALAAVRTGKGRADEALAAKSEAVERLEANLVRVSALNGRTLGE
jgi:hypothetical protein